MCVCVCVPICGRYDRYLLFAPELRAQPLEETFATQAEIEDAVFKVTVAINNIVDVALKRGMKLQQVGRSGGRACVRSLACCLSSLV